MKGKLTVVGFGPGSKEDMTFRAASAIEEADIVTGYTTYIDILKEFFPGKIYKSTGMMKEVERCRMAVEDAMSGKNVAMVSSGDSGIYGMAGIVYQIADEMGAEIDIETVPGITAASSAASLLGAPLMHDLALISLSDLMTPFDLIMKRVDCAGIGDMVIAFYNPKSKSRTDYLEHAVSVLLKYRSGDTPVGIVRNIGRKDQKITITTMSRIDYAQVDMFCTVVIGNSQTYVSDGRMITPRGYKI
ncbi:S-adenosyl-L-methionine-dependent uroporphyrinogen III methyltransferase [Candidatus Methanoplasma termitum]|uniref:S-adenosyl-L-methionine-dependent uroporphyrinogen III methyltransferase n=1 Tax=Candidatus Methanoplasma termitum TaxID=1577791 RepID=A0A0A7LGK1_9ARCH|nr:precorrin-3B C(17)-methyltransferase [Candidatus Methanoplasma termitum]AIZ56596.1 S-adenosyl-L-methionine-dependent uroporphyrinogen III methyltransferase [Candidatus Methanoplasma termitum]MCL2333844.1 precorrin-3B C(17)-methyltransferase [Candidatus Methanoplasma sp.]